MWEMLTVHASFSFSFKVSDDHLNGSGQFDLFKSIVEVLIQTEISK